jgi:hypothetical protein
VRIVLGFLSGVVGMLAGWAGLAFLVVSLAGPDRDGGIAMGAFFNIGPIGGIAGFAAGIYLFIRFGLVAQPAPAAGAAPVPSEPSAPSGAAQSAAAVASRPTKISRPFAAVILLIVGGVAWWGWYEFIRSPYLTHGFMNLALQFKLPEGVPIPADPKEIKILLDEGGRFWPGQLNAGWHGHQGSRVVLLATASMSYKASRRTVTLSMPGARDQTWTIDLPYDPDPTAEFTEWAPSSKAPDAIELNWRLTADR